jgi:hypothetical protein
MPTSRPAVPMAALLLRAGGRERLCAAVALAGLGAACLVKRSHAGEADLRLQPEPEPEPEPEPNAERPPQSQSQAPQTQTQTQTQRKIRPQVIDLREDSEVQIRCKCRASLEGTLTPMLALRNHGCESVCAEMAARARAHHQTASLNKAQQACELDGPLAPLADVARAELLALTYRLLGILAEGDAGASAALGQLEGRLCLRAYPVQQEETVRLGAHCDATLLTLLWSDAPGLQVMDAASVPDWTPSDVMGYGLPSMTGAPKLLQDHQWAEVDLPWADGCLLMTVGTAWMGSAESARLPAAKSAVLHRVLTLSGVDRVSLPFLVDRVATQ